MEILNRWYTNYPHFDNNQTMAEFLDSEMDQKWKVLIDEGTYAEVETDDGRVLALHARGDGDSFNHVIEFETLIEKDK